MPLSEGTPTITRPPNSQGRKSTGLLEERERSGTGTEQPARSIAQATEPDGGKGPAAREARRGVRVGDWTAGVDSSCAPQGALRVSPHGIRGKGQGAVFPMPRALGECLRWVTAKEKR